MKETERAGQFHASQFVCRGVRGATIAAVDTREEIHSATMELVKAILEANSIHQDDLASAFFTTTPDLHAAFPAAAARLMGWECVPMLGAIEMDKPGAPQRCIRVMLHWKEVSEVSTWLAMVLFIGYPYQDPVVSLRNIDELSPLLIPDDHSPVQENLPRLSGLPVQKLPPRLQRENCYSLQLPRVPN